MIYLTKTIPNERPEIVETDSPVTTLLKLLDDDASYHLRLMIDRDVVVLCDDGRMTVTNEGNIMIASFVGDATDKVKKITKKRKVRAFITFC